MAYKKTQHDDKHIKQSAKQAETTITNPVTNEEDDLTNILIDRYDSGTEDMDIRRTRKNGWNELFKAYLNVLPENWPYQAKVTDPRIRTTLNEKTARLLNSKLQGHLVPREGGDNAGARINNTILDYQWDTATLGGTMLEKVSKSDNIARIVGAAFHYNYWDAENNTNESKPCDPRDIFIDPAADHIHNARWVMYREYVTVSDLKDQYDLSDIDLGQTQTRESNYDSVTREVRRLEDKVGKDKANPVVEVITQWVPNWATSDRKGRKTTFLPHYKHLLEDVENPHSNHGKVPFSQLRYYAIHDDVYGESEIEPVIPLQRAINAVLCGYIDEMNLAMRPPVKVMEGETRLDTIVFGPGAIWLVKRQDAVEESKVGGNSIQAFNNTYPALIAAFNTAMGDQSLGVSNISGKREDKTATEVNQLSAQQFTRDQWNQLFLGEFLKDIMMQWQANNKQFLFDDESKHVHIIKVVGKDKIKDLQQLGLDDTEVPKHVINEIAEIIANAGEAVSNEELDALMEEVQVPSSAVIINPNESDPDKMDVRSKLKILEGGEAELAVTKEDLKGSYDYIPDIKSMAAGASKQQEAARKQAMEMAMNPTVIQMLEKEGKKMIFSELLVNMLEDAGFNDAESFIEDIYNGQEQIQQQAGVQPPGQPGFGAGQIPVGDNGEPGLPQVPQALPDPAGAGMLPQPEGLPY